MLRTSQLSSVEKEWQTNQAWLKSCGYQLRPRYQPTWIPSWITNPPADEILGKWRREDFIGASRHHVIDAIRIEDGMPVMLKRVLQVGNNTDQELEISLHLSSPELRKDPHNHCVPIYEVLEHPDEKYGVLVMPLLREYSSPRFDTIGECMDFLQQIFRGLQFTHQQHVAHRDCTGPNVMLDGSELYPDGFHPMKQDYNRDFKADATQRYTRTQRPPKYYWINFSNSARFDPSETLPRAERIYGKDLTLPEYRDLYKCSFNPFHEDIYYLGNLIRTRFTEGCQEYRYPRIYSLGFLTPLVQDMVQDDPEKRPTIDQCINRLDNIIRKQSSWTLRSQVWYSNDHPVEILFRLIPHWLRRIYYIVTRTPAIPQRRIE